MRWLTRFRRLFVRQDEMSAAWLRSYRMEGTRVTFEGPNWRFPILKARDASGWRNRIVLRRSA